MRYLHDLSVEQRVEEGVDLAVERIVSLAQLRVEAVEEGEETRVDAGGEAGLIHGHEQAETTTYLYTYGEWMAAFAMISIKTVLIAGPGPARLYS